MKTMDRIMYSVVQDFMSSTEYACMQSASGTLLPTDDQRSAFRGSHVRLLDWSTVTPTWGIWGYVSSCRSVARDLPHFFAAFHLYLTLAIDPLDRSF